MNPCTSLVFKAVRLRDSLDPTLLSTLRRRFKADCKRLLLPSHRRLFHSVAPEVYERVFRIAAELRGAQRRARSEDADAVFKFLLGLTKIHRCAGCDLRILRGEYCSATCLTRLGLRNETSDAKREATLLRKYGVTNAGQTEKSRRQSAFNMSRRNPDFADQMTRRVRTTQERYGVDNVAQLEEVHLRMKESTLERFGSETSYHSHVLKLSRQSNLRKYGVESYSKTPDFRRRLRTTSQRKYGTDNPMQDPEICRRSATRARRIKLHSLKDKRVLRLQGYEPILAEYLDKKTGFYLEEATESIPYQWFDRRRRYTPDLVVTKSDGQVVWVEVKSLYTLESDLQVNLAKFRAANAYCKKRGIQFVLTVIRKAGDSQDSPDLLNLLFPTRQSVILTMKENS